MIVAWPTAEASAIDPEDAVDLLFGREYSGSDQWERIRKEKVAEFKKSISLDEALEAGMIDDVIDPRDTRSLIVKALGFSKKRRKGYDFKIHGISPI
jgi:propionyl-CoA carboxylase beta chain